MHITLVTDNISHSCTHLTISLNSNQDVVSRRSILFAQVTRSRRTAVDAGVGGCDIFGIEGSACSAYKIGTGFEHILAVGHAFRAPVAAYVNSSESRALVEHVRHVCHLTGIETAQIDGDER